MANVPTKGNGTLHVVLDGSTNYDAGRVYQVLAIEICPIAGNDLCTIRDETVTGVKVVKVKMSADTDQRYFDFSRFQAGSKDMRPCVASADVSANVELIIHFAG